MATKYQVTLSADGKHSVSVSSDDPEIADAALEWAKDIYRQLAGPLGREPNDQSSPQTNAEIPYREDEPPICQVHHVPMVRVQGRRGPFWSCHQRNADESWCSYKPE